MPEPVDAPEGLVGSRRVVAIQTRGEDTGEVIVSPAPRGFAVFTAKGRMMAILHAAGRSPPGSDAGAAALFRHMTAYTGRYRVEGTAQSRGLTRRGGPAGWTPSRCGTSRWTATH